MAKANSTLEVLLKKGKKAAFSTRHTPMLATLVDAPFDAEGWQYEIKWDGYRALSFSNKGKVELLSRNSKSFNEKFYPVYESIRKWNKNVILDGEIIVADRNGQANFSNLQNWRSEADGVLQFYVFDILWYEGLSLMHLPLEDRRKILQLILPQSELLKLSVNFPTTASEFFATAQKMGLEGIMAKRASSVYEPGARSREWLKIKTELRHEVVIGGFTRNEGTAKPFSSLLVGVHEGGKLQYTGKIGTGFSIKLQREMMEQMEPLITTICPFNIVPDINKPSRFRPDPPMAEATWLKPKLVCEVSYRELTSDLVMRHPSFRGMRMDKDASKVVAEKKIRIDSKKVKASGGSSPMIQPVTNDTRKTLLNPTEESRVKKINGHEITFNNLRKIFWPKEKFTKRDLLNYYYRIAPVMLPYLKDRPESLNRFPNGIEGKSFYQKDITGKAPSWMKMHPYESEGIRKNFLVCNDEATLLYMASLGCIEINPWSSRIQKPGNPDWCIIDLDPDKQSFNQVIETALMVRQVLQAGGIDGYCKTSGSTGLHIYIPLGAKYTYEDSKEFGRLIAHLVNAQLPAFTSIERLISNRNRKLYIDFLQNRPGATLAAPYSLRPKPGAPVSMPLHWDEVKKGMKLTDFNIKNAVERVMETGDIFKPVLGKGINMKSAIKRLQANFKEA